MLIVLDPQQRRPSLPPRAGRQPSVSSRLSISSNNSSTGEPKVKLSVPPKPMKPNTSRISSSHSISETQLPTPHVSSGTLLPPPSLANLVNQNQSK